MRLRSLVCSAGVEKLVDGGDEVRRRRLDGDGAGEDGLVGDVLAVVGVGVVLILIDYVTGEVDAGEDALAAGVGEKGGIDGGGGLSITTDGTCGY